MDRGEEASDLDVATFDFFTCTADTEELLDRFTNDRACPWNLANVTFSITQETKLLKETVT